MKILNEQQQTMRGGMPEDGMNDRENAQEFDQRDLGQMISGPAGMLSRFTMQ